MPASPALAGSYQQYKIDTSVFATWLLNTALDCGFTGHRLSEKLNQAKSSKSAVKCQITVQQLLAQAKFIAKGNRPNLLFPLHVERAAERAVETRRRFVQHFTTLGSNPKSDATHSHFLDILEQSLEIVKSKRAPPRIVQRQDASSDQAHTLNSFSCLHVEDVDEAFVQQSLAASAEKKGIKNVEILGEDIGSDQKEDRRFEVLCFLADIWDVGNFVGDTWYGYAQGAIDIKAAAMITNAAVSLVKQAEQEILESTKISAKDSYLRLVEVFHDTPPNEPDWPMMLGPDQLVDDIGQIAQLGTLQSLYIYVKTMRQHYPDMEEGKSRTSFIPANSIISDPCEIPANVCHAGLVCLIPILGMRLLHRQITPELEQRAEYETMADDHDALMTWLMDLSIHQTALRKTPPKGPCKQLEHMDEVSQALSTIVKGGITAQAVSSASMLRHIRHMLMEHPSLAPFQKLKATLKNDVPYYATDTAAYAKQHTQGRCWPQEALRIRNHLDCFQTYYPKYSMPLKAILINVLHTHYNFKARVPDLDFVEPSKDQLHVFKMNPVYCGTVAANVMIRVEEAGVMYANYHLSVILCAYLYFALRSREIVQKWPAMDSLIEEHLGSIFFGTRPEDAEQLYMRFKLRMGVPRSSGASNCRRAPGKRIQVKPSETKTRLQPSCLAPAKTIVPLRQYFKGDMTMLRATYALDDILKKNEASEKSRKDIKPQDSNNEDDWFDEEGEESDEEGEYLPATQMLIRLRDHLPQMLKSVSIDYVRLTWDCKDLLRAIKNSGKLDVSRPTMSQTAYKWDDEDTCSHFIHYINMLEQILYSNLGGCGKECCQRAGLLDLRVAGVFMSEMLKSKLKTKK